MTTGNAELDTAVHRHLVAARDVGFDRLERIGAPDLVELLQTVGLAVAAAVLRHVDVALEADALGRADATPDQITAGAVAPLLVRTVAGSPAAAVCTDLSGRDLTRGARPDLFSRPMVAEPELHAQMARTFETIDRLGAFDHVFEVFGVLVVSGHPRPAGHLAHGTRGVLTGTVFADPMPDDCRFAEMVVHEAAHSWLHLCAAAIGERFDTGATFFSPWRRCERPLAMFLQAVFAFGHVARFQQLADEHGLVAPGDAADFARDRAYNRDRLAEARPILPAALAEVDERLHPMILAAASPRIAPR